MQSIERVRQCVKLGLVIGAPTERNPLNPDSHSAAVIDLIRSVFVSWIRRSASSIEVYCYFHKVFTVLFFKLLGCRGQQQRPAT